MLPRIMEQNLLVIYPTPILPFLPNDKNLNFILDGNVQLKYYILEPPLQITFMLFSTVILGFLLSVNFTIYRKLS